jgi:hypothetical protein
MIVSGPNQSIEISRGRYFPERPRLPFPCWWVSRCLRGCSAKQKPGKNGNEPWLPSRGLGKLDIPTRSQILVKAPIGDVWGYCEDSPGFD